MKASPLFRQEAVLGLAAAGLWLSDFLVPPAAFLAALALALRRFK
jgi:hypothetical protein